MVEIERSGQSPTFRLLIAQEWTILTHGHDKVGPFRVEDRTQFFVKDFKVFLIQVDPRQAFIIVITFSTPKRHVICPSECHIRFQPALARGSTLRIVQDSIVIVIKPEQQFRGDSTDQ